MWPATAPEIAAGGAAIERSESWSQIDETDEARTIARARR